MLFHAPWRAWTQRAQRTRSCPGDAQLVVAFDRLLRPSQLLQVSTVGLLSTPAVHVPPAPGLNAQPGEAEGDHVAKQAAHGVEALVAAQRLALQLIGRHLLGPEHNVLAVVELPARVEQATLRLHLGILPCTWAGRENVEHQGVDVVPEGEVYGATQCLHRIAVAT